MKPIYRIGIRVLGDTGELRTATISEAPVARAVYGELGETGLEVTLYQYSHNNKCWRIVESTAVHQTNHALKKLRHLKAFAQLGLEGIMD